jgi:DNA-binding transcriptional regulator YiaG
MLHDQDEQRASHQEIIDIADEALSVAGEAIKVAREKLKVAQRNYADRMRLPTLEAQNGQRNHTQHL